MGITLLLFEFGVFGRLGRRQLFMFLFVVYTLWPYCVRLFLNHANWSVDTYSLRSGYVPTIEWIRIPCGLDTYSLLSGYVSIVAWVRIHCWVDTYPLINGIAVFYFADSSPLISGYVFLDEWIRIHWSVDIDGSFGTDAVVDTYPLIIGYWRLHWDGGCGGYVATDQWQRILGTHVIVILNGFVWWHHCKDARNRCSQSRC